MSISQTPAGEGPGHSTSGHATSGQAIPRAADIFDAQAFAVRLAEARRRRARILGQRITGHAAPPPARPVPPAAAPAAATSARRWPFGAGLALGFSLATVLAAGMFLALRAPAAVGPAPATPVVAARLSPPAALPAPAAFAAGTATAAPARLGGLGAPAADLLPDWSTSGPPGPLARPADLPRATLPATRGRRPAAPASPVLAADPVVRALGAFIGRVERLVGPSSPRQNRGAGRGN